MSHSAGDSRIDAAHSWSLFLATIALLRIAWIFLDCYLCSALIDANNLLVPAASPLAAFASACGASAMGYMLEHQGLKGALWLSTLALALTAGLTIPFIRRSEPVSLLAK